MCPIENARVFASQRSWALRQKIHFSPDCSRPFRSISLIASGEGMYEMRRACLLSRVLNLALLATMFCPVSGVAQNLAPDTGLQPCSGVTGQTAACELIAWSQIQQPQPLQPAPRPSPDQQTEKPPKGLSKTEVENQPPIIGIVVKDGGSYALKTGDATSCQLDDQGRVKKYEGKKVKIDGALDENSKVIHVESVESF
jgi:Protein of unknown function (DUF5818)